MSGWASVHVHHADRGRPNARCPLCQADPHLQRLLQRPPSPRKVVLTVTEIDALRTFIERVDHMMQFVRGLLRE